MSWAPFGKPKSWSSSAVAACASALLPTEGVSGLQGSVSPQVLNILSQVLSLALRMPPSASCLLGAYTMLPDSCSVNDTYKINACQAETCWNDWSGQLECGFTGSICGGLLTSLQTYSWEVMVWDAGAEFWMHGPCQGINVSVLSIVFWSVCIWPDENCTSSSSHSRYLEKGSPLGGQVLMNVRQIGASSEAEKPGWQFWVYTGMVEKPRQGRTWGRLPHS